MPDVMYVSVKEMETLLNGIRSGTPAQPGSPVELNEEQIRREIVAASAEIDSTLGERFTVPFANDPAGEGESTPTVIRYITRDIAAYLCDLTYRMSRNYKPGSENPFVLRYQRATAWLTALANGSKTLPGIDEDDVLGGADAFDQYMEGWLADPAHIFAPGQSIVDGYFVRDGVIYG